MAPSPRALLTIARTPLAAALVRELRSRDAVVAVLEAGSGGNSPLPEGVERLMDPGNATGLGDLLRKWSPTHVFHELPVRITPGWSEQETPGLLEAMASLESRPRVVLASTGRARSKHEAMLRASGLPFTLARRGRLLGPGGDAPLGNGLAAAWASAARLLGLARQCARFRPFEPAELAYGLVHAGFNYTTIDRVLKAEELRYEIANDREYHLPRSRRDELRH